MADNISRVGKVSSINYENGTIRVTYPAMDNAVTEEFPVINMGGEYFMPAIGDRVLVLHLSNGAATGFVLGKFWDADNKPAEHGADIFRKEMAKKAGEAYLRYNGTTELKGPEVKLTASSGSVTVSQILNLIKRVGALEAKV